MLSTEHTNQTDLDQTKAWRIVVLTTKGTFYTKSTWPSRQEAEAKIRQVESGKNCRLGFKVNDQKFTWPMFIWAIPIPA